MRYLACIVVCLLLLVACNNRESLLLPADLSPADYLEGNHISAYSNYLVKSANDDSYLLIYKEAIADSLLSIGDEIVFYKAESFSSRDSLGLQDSAQKCSDTYRFGVLRAGQPLSLKARIDLAEVYTRVNSTSGLQLVSLAYYLTANGLQPQFYNNTRAHFPLRETGEFAVYSFSGTAQAQLSHSGSGSWQALLLDGEGNQVNLNFPSTYTAAAGEISISLSPELSQGQQNVLNSIYPNAAISAPLIKLQTQNDLSSEIAILRIINTRKGALQKQWTQLNNSELLSWPENDPQGGTPNWWQDENTFYGFLKGKGTYFLLSPLESQESLDLPLDGSIDQAYLQDLWFDLNSLDLDQGILRVNPGPDVSGLISDYFSSNPYSFNGAVQAYELNFYQGSAPLAVLPDDAWIEFGFRTVLPDAQNNLLYRVYRSALEDIISYKSPALSYDSSHYSRSGNYIYSGINSSATYLFGASQSQGNLLSLPYYKSRQYFQLAQAKVSWQDSVKRGYSHVTLNLQPNLPEHNWLSGEPFSLSGQSALAELKAYAGSELSLALPAGTYLHLPRAVNQSVLLFDNSSYPRLKDYHSGSSFDGESYVPDSEGTGFSPEFPGVLVAAQLSYPNPLPLRVFAKQTFVFGEFRLYTYGTAEADSSIVINISRYLSLPDSYGALANQYQLSPSSPAFIVSAEPEAALQDFQPMLFFKRQSRQPNLLFFESLPQNEYRLYAYTESDGFDPWHFYIDGGYNGLSLLYNGGYQSFVDNNPTSTRTIPVNGAADTVLSLYQAQVNLPQFFAGGVLPAGASLGLQKLSSLPGINNMLTAYLLTLNGPGGNVLNPGFYSVVGAPRMPYLYIPVEDTSALPEVRVFFRNLAGTTVELNVVDQFTANYANESVRVGNCFICTINNPGFFYVTTP